MVHFLSCCWLLNCKFSSVSLWFLVTLERDKREENSFFFFFFISSEDLNLQLTEVICLYR